ncbi:hypothetical protein GCM10007160_18400 [Litchfieldella qijiaojingensis]|uniref:Uncharacterized protein n=1 Tax=Litchfieldella qijiaojingensis TaxID=980347 RepID=A0ABQ2YR43_9GAMM|nr:hypothetical protein [Halomonas qijiaojingensis]GGX91222.1 hypothetical protein GCM10007160_18400 [Halomonas qijiaojingensis]
MKINILATPDGPDYYGFDGETIIAYVDGHSKSYDLSDFPEGGELTNAEKIKGVIPIWSVERVNGELKVFLCQEVGPGYWSESGWFNVSGYDPRTVHVVRDTSKLHYGKAWVKTRDGIRFFD